MLRLNQIVRNFFIRLEALFSVVFRTFFGFLSQFLGLLGKLFGFSKSEYFVESNERQDTKSVKAQELTATESVKAPEAISTTRRRPNGKTDDYFLNMAKQVKKS